MQPIFDTELAIARKRARGGARRPGADFLMPRAAEDLAERLVDGRAAVSASGGAVLR